LSRSYDIRQKLRPAMLALRDTEDWARLELQDELLATRIREIHESLTEDVLNGVSYKYSSRFKSKLWERYCLLRNHDPDSGATLQSKRIRKKGWWF